ncbi:MAG: type II secretion system protein [Acidimicrobiia bacterium]
MCGRRNSNDGFTLIELMVVVLVIAILLAIAIPTFLGARGRSQDSVAKSSVRLAAEVASAAAPTGGLASLTAAALGADEPSLAFVTAPALSTGPKVVSISAGASQWSAAALSGSGKCFWTRIDASGVTTTGSMTTACRADATTSTTPVSSGLIVALDANTLGTLSQDSAGTVAVLAAGQSVCRWGDASGVGNHATQATLAQCPVYGSDAAGGYLNFTANGWLSNSPTLSPDASVFVVAQSNTATYNTYGWVASARGPNGFILHPWVGGNSYGAFTMNSGGTYFGAGSTNVTNLTAPTIYEMTIHGSGTVTGVWGINGTTTAYTQSGVSRTAGPVAITYGSDGTSWGRLGDGKFREVLIYDRELTAGERQQVESYLRTKWGTG